MSETPTGPTGPTDATASFETLGPPGLTEPREGRARRRLVVAGVAGLVVALLGGGAYAAYSFLAGSGPDPEDVLPASTVAVISVDLDPSAGQKIEAIKTIRKFPALKKQLGLQADDDLRKWAFDKILDEADCKQLSFDDDVKSWLGKRAAFGAVDLGDKEPAPVLAVQITDKDQATRGFKAFVDCTKPGEDFAYVVGEDYVIVSDSPAHAKSILDQGETKPLADDTAYQKWTDEVGDAGVVNFYVASRAARYAVDLLDQMPADLLGIGGSDPLGAAKDGLDAFQGLGGTVRFSDGGMELAVAGGGIQKFSGLSDVGAEVGALPSDTAVAFGFGLDKDFAQRITDGIDRSEGSLEDAEQETGLKLPEDLQTLLGRAITISLGADAPASLDDVDEPADVPAGLVIHGDGAKIRAIIATVEEHVGMHLSDIPLVVDGSDDKAVIATARDYADALLQGGKLGTDDGFRAAVPNAARSTGILFVDFDSAWRDSLVAMAGGEGPHGEELAANSKPLRSLGLSSWRDGDVTHGLLKVATR